jgi:DNA-binding transcriptional regulator LsrR (DeoR family)
MRGNGDDGQGYVSADEAAESRKEAKQEAERQTRDAIIAEIYESNDDMTQKQLADSVGLSRSRVADILSTYDG